MSVSAEETQLITVSAGDSIPSIAHDSGHFWETLWNHPDNAELKALRKNPNILAPGDEVTVPPIRIKDFSGGTDARHSFKRKGVPAKLKMQLFLLGEPRSNEKYTLILDGEIIHGTTDAGKSPALPIISCRSSVSAGHVISFRNSDIASRTRPY